MRRLLQFSAGLLGRQTGKLFEGAVYALCLAGIPYRTGAWVMRALGDDRLEKVTILSGLKVFELEADMLAIGYHLVPNSELAQLLHCEIDRGVVIHGDDNHAAESATKEGCDPFRSVLAPEHHAIALRDSPRLQFASESKGHFQNFAVGERLSPVSAPLAVGALLPVRLKMLQKKFCDRFSHGPEF